MVVLLCEFATQQVNICMYFQSPVISIVLSLDFYTSIYRYIHAQMHTVAYLPAQRIYSINFGYIHVFTSLVRTGNHVYLCLSYSQQGIYTSSPYVLTIQSQTVSHSIRCMIILLGCNLLFLWTYYLLLFSRNHSSPYMHTSARYDILDGRFLSRTHTHTHTHTYSSHFPWSVC